MKKALKVAFVIAALCSLFLATYAGPVKAVNPNYTQTVYAGSIDATIDGKWTSNDEWDDAGTSQISANAVFRDKYWLVMSGTTFFVYDEYLVEFFSDKTNDTGDYVQILYDTASNGGSAPQTDDLRMDYVGHNGTVKTYVGTGTGWTAGTVNDLQVAELVSISKLNGTNPHWTAEFRVEKTTNNMGINNDIMVAVYDASNPSAGVQTWPPGASANVPDGWGLNDASALSPIPEGLGIGSTVILASVAVLFGFYSLRKRSRTGRSSSTNVGE
jgi:hypothetical protein